MTLSIKFRRFIFIEAVIATIIPIIVGSIFIVSIGAFLIAEALDPIIPDHRGFALRVIQILPYLGTLFALILFWSKIHDIFLGRKISVGLGTLVAALLALCGTVELLIESNITIALIIAAPPWLVTAHMLYLHFIGKILVKY